ncbi:MAG: DUF115 domain-containing protein [Spirochaetales bacterium]|jgi:hypothetical protein|nr:DUF115 domain-containing protein [Spirochaetales bacterium]
MEKILPSKSGLPTAVSGGRYLHSSYDPAKEAQRFSLSAGHIPRGSIVVLLGEALGYLSRQLQKDHPGIRILPVYCSAYFYENRTDPSGGDDFSSWRPGGPETFGVFLRRRIPDTQFPALRVLEWEAAERAFPRLMRLLREDLARFGRQVNGSLLTTAVFGKKWITNSIRNYLALDKASVLKKLSGPVCIAASGPGLADALSFLERKRRSFTLFALPSAADFLTRRGIIPEAIFMTDPGFYTGLHFRALARLAGKTENRAASPAGPALLMPLPAYAGLRGGVLPAALFHQGSAPEKILLEGIPGAPPYIPSNGTVAGTAMQAALSLGAGPVILAGMDMAARGIEEHVRPNAFDEYYAADGRRLKPEEGERAARIFTLYPDRLDGAWRTSPSLRTYAGWFSSMADARPGSIFRVSASPVDTGGGCTFGEAEKLLGEKPDCVFERMSLPALNQRREKVFSFIKTIEKSVPDDELAMLIDTAGVLELKKAALNPYSAQPDREKAEARVLAEIADFCSFLYSVLKAL